MRLPYVILITTVLFGGFARPGGSGPAADSSRERGPRASASARRATPTGDQASPSVVCLMFHRFASADEFNALSADEQDYCITPARFDSILRLLKRRGYTALTLRQAADFVHGRTALPARSVLITIDDGCRSALTLGAPILHRHGMTATLFVTTDPHAFVFGGTHSVILEPAGTPSEIVTRRVDPRMSDDEIRGWASMGFDVGAHSATHCSLTAVDEKQAAREIANSKRELEKVLGRPVIAMAAPCGRWNTMLARTARGQGYDLAFTSRPAPIKHGDNPFALPRMNISGRWNNSAIAKRLQPAPHERTARAD